MNQVLGTDYEDGEELSGGQWQKLAIARAFYQAAPVLILDEPTSAIDAEAEAAIFDNLAAECTGLAFTRERASPRSDVALVLSRGFAGTDAALLIRAARA